MTINKQEETTSLYTNAYNWITQLRAQAIALTLLLLLLMTTLSVGAAFLAYRQVSQSLAQSRDEELAIVGAERLSKRMENLMRNLSALADQPEMKLGEPTIQEATLNRAPTLIADFTNYDGGIIILDANGFVSVTEPFRPDLIGQDFSQESYFQEARALRTFTFSNITQEPNTHQNTIVIAVPIIDLEGGFAGVLAGRFYLSFQGLGKEIEELKVGKKGTAYLVDRNGDLIYHPIDALIGTDFSHRQVVQQLLKGDQRTGAIATQENNEPRTIEGFSLVPITGWGLVIGEPWEQVVEPALASLEPVATVLILGLIMVAGVVSLGVRQVTDPIQNLVTQIRQVAAGDYDTQVTLSRIKEIRELSMAFNEMVQQIDKYRAGVRHYVADITKSQEEERKRIARELHDDTIQSLIAIGQRIELIKGSLDDPPKARSRLTELRTMVTGTIASVRQFSRDLRPLALEDLGLEAAIQYQIGQLIQQENIKVDFSVEGILDGLSSDMEVAIYRILQESLNNVRRHAHADHVKVLVKATKGHIKLTVQDNGQGFEVPEALTDFASNGSFGMMGLQERARLFGGDINVQSQPNQGTTLRLILPRQLPSSNNNNGSHQE